MSRHIHDLRVVARAMSADHESSPQSFICFNANYSPCPARRRLNRALTDIDLEIALQCCCGKSAAWTTFGIIAWPAFWRFNAAATYAARSCLVTPTGLHFVLARVLD